MTIGGIDIPAGFEAADRHVVREPRRAPLRRCRRLRHPARERQRPPDLRLRQRISAWARTSPAWRCRSSSRSSPSVCRTCELVPDQTFTYLPNTSFRGPDHLFWCEWDPAKNPGAHRSVDPRDRQPVKIGEPSKTNITRTVTVDAITPAADGVVRVTLLGSVGRGAAAAGPGFAHRRRLRRTGLSRQYSLCGDPNDLSAFEIAVLERAREPRRFALGAPHVRRGRTLKMRGPRNHFRLDETRERYMLVAGGIGITPISAMARPRQAAGMDYEIHYSGRSRHDGAARRLMARCTATRLRVYVSEEGTRNDFARARRPGRRHASLRVRPGAHARCTRRGERVLARRRAQDRTFRIEAGHARSAATSAHSRSS